MTVQDYWGREFKVKKIISSISPTSEEIDKFSKKEYEEKLDERQKFIYELEN